MEPMYSIVIPVHNEAENIMPLYSRLAPVLDKLSLQSEVIFVDDGSTDNTFKMINSICETDPRVRGIRFLRNFKKSAAYMAGFRASRGEIIITMDGDLQDDPEEIPKFIEAIKKYDLVVGWKFERKDPIMRRTASKMFNFLNSKFFSLKIHDCDCGFRAMKSEVAKELNLYGDLYRYVPVLVSRFGYKVGEIKVRHHERKFGKSGYGTRRLLTGSFDLLTVKYMIDANERPLHLFGSLGLVTFLLGGLICIYLLLLKVLYATRLMDRPLLLLGILLVILGIQFIMLGFIGDMIVRTYYDNTERKTYMIAEETGKK
jgi:glycosyltransferase involved in cell wall biosynthesis